MQKVISKELIQALIENHYSGTYGSLEQYLKQRLYQKQKDDGSKDAIERAGGAFLKSRADFSEHLEQRCRHMLLLSCLAELLSEEHGLAGELYAQCLKYLLQEIQELLPETVCYLQREPLKNK